MQTCSNGNCLSSFAVNVMLNLSCKSLNLSYIGQSGLLMIEV